MEDLKEYMHKQAKFIDGPLVLMMVVTGLFTYLGVESALGSNGSDTMERLSAAAFALGSGTAGFALWKHALHLVPHLPGGKHLFKGLAALLLGLVFIVFLSSYLNVVAIGGANAQRAAMFAAVGDFETALGESEARLSQAAEVRANLANGAGILDNWAQAEATRGALTGHPGKGTVYTAALAAAGQMRTLRKTLDEGLSEGATLAGQARGHLQAMRAVAESETGVPERLGRFATESDRMRSVLVSLNSLELAGALSRDLERLATAETTMAPSARSEAVAEAQQDAVRRLVEITQTVAKPMADRAVELGRWPVPNVPKFHRISTVEAVWVHGLSILPLWAGGLALDLMPLVLLLLFRIKRDSELPPDDKRRDNGDHLTIGDVKRARAALDDVIGRHATGKTNTGRKQP
ncbi:hypothetical protein [Rhodospira trueperi]|uniref:DUF4407 domain-containing protein n=1 Tax=Rhodospira trueperi TaxID=69960 RepID=A0A1G7HHZ3_9PROT|nr:hypothetical protein [Rhodospira trueperi]SDE99894.1 hypothetical protein SAMN05421720_12118 [Rhodospira trueperi]